MKGNTVGEACLLSSEYHSGRVHGGDEEETTPEPPHGGVMGPTL